jgi:hypothetical protein
VNAPNSERYAPTIAELRWRHQEAEGRWKAAADAAAQAEREMNEAWLDLFNAECAADRAAHNQQGGEA